MTNALILSEQQQAIIDWAISGTGSLNLEARAGCGKTFTLLQLIQHMKGQGFIGAYNKAIAEEIKGKLAKAGIDWKVCEAGTMHSMGFRAWKKMCPKTPVVEAGKVYNILQNLIEQAEVEGEFERAEFIREIIQVACKTISYAKNRGLGALAPYESDDQWYDIIDHFAVEDDFPENFSVSRFVALCKEVYKISLNTCREVIDFDDMLLAPLVFKARFWQLDYVFIDEAQDTNPVRRALALKLLKAGGRLVAVGDPFQAIYGFTGADSDSMDQLAKHLGSATLPMTKTYRCAKSIIRFANRWVPDIEAHEDNPEGMVRTIGNNNSDGKPWYLTETIRPDDAILCRNTKPLVEVAYGMIRAGIPCKVEGREIGAGLMKLANRWKSIKTLKTLSPKIEDYKITQTQKWMAKGREDQAQNVEDLCDTLQAMISGTMTKYGFGATVSDLSDEIKRMFDDNVKGVCTLSTVHKSKGREWNRVFLFGRNKFMPSRYARQPWQQQQERNLIYVGITRAINELVEVYVEEEKK